VKDDGLLGLFRGGGPTVVRAMALNMGMLASNDQAKEMIEAAGFTKGGSVAVLGGASIAGMCIVVSMLGSMSGLLSSA
jgi:solute carrier family 25 oxoglutarate transporter 11